MKTMTLKHVDGSDRFLDHEHAAVMCRNSAHTPNGAQWYAALLTRCGYTLAGGTPVTETVLREFIGAP